MTKSKLTDDQWDALFEEERAGVPRKVLAVKYGVHTGAINRKASLSGRLKRRTGAPDQRCRPAGGWPDDRVAPGAVFLPAGPKPITLENLPDDRIRLKHRDRAFVLDRKNPRGAVETLLGQAEVSAVEGRREACAADLRMAGLITRILIGTARGRSLVAGPPELATDYAGPGDALDLRPAQRPPGLFPDGSDWSTWLFLGGRGAGKTLAGASWLADQAEILGPGGRVALVGPTLHDVREVMIEGPSGLRALPRWTRATRPAYEPSRRRLVFAGGCIAHAFSAEDPDSLRGPQFSAAWADEFCAWPSVGSRGAAETLALLRMGLRLPLPGVAKDGAQAAGARGASDSAPRLVVTTTPRPTRALVALRDEPSCALSHAGTADNADHLSPGFVEALRALYGGTRREAQEIEGRIVDLDGALFTAEMMAVARGNASASPSPAGGGGSRSDRVGRAGDPDADPASPSPPPEGEGEAVCAPLDRVVVALDPTTTTTGDACGIIVAGSRRRPDGVREAVVLADRSVHGLSPDQWARRAVRAAQEFGATAIVAEVNQGGDMVSAVLRTAGCALRVREVRATRGKRVRAEPVAALYEQGRVRHAPADGVPLSALEEELMAFAGEMEGAGSLDRADALVWAVTDLLIDAPEGEQGPRVRWL
ncbi:MAG: terminase family protein [Brevundimonas sp.]|uniref:terminase large subunit domain-containing protein n=1 Tax=Brevundimonas sp. TaxID=1871086 RepID=UPI0024884735|nr:terminase family protein [Brevundimonas sp.]MDI1325399.1 terminase family protein [Brevundimonas sp.]